MERKHILQSQPCQELSYKICELLEESIGSSLDFFLEKSRFGKETAMREMGFGNTLLLLIVRSLAQGSTFLCGILMELAKGFEPFDSPFLADWLSQDFRIEQETVEKALQQAIRLNCSKVILVPDAVLQILIKLARKTGIEVIIDEAEETVGGSGNEEEEAAGTSQQEEAKAGTCQLKEAAAGTGQLEENAAGTSQLEEATAGTCQLEEAAAGTSQLEEATAGTCQLEEATEGTYQLEEAAAGTSLLEMGTIATSRIEEWGSSVILKLEKLNRLLNQYCEEVVPETSKGCTNGYKIKEKVDSEKGTASKKGLKESAISDLHSAASRNRVDVVKALLEKGVRVDAVNSDGETPMTVAVKYDFPEIVNVLLKYKANIRRKIRGGNSYVHVAVACRSAASLLVLLENGASVDSVNCQGETPLAIAIKENVPDLVQLLIDSEADVMKKPGGETYLHQAVKDGSLDSLRVLLECGVPPDLQGSDGTTPILLAVEQDDIESAAVLADFWADLNQRWGNGGNLLHYAAYSDSIACIRWLVQGGLHVDSTDSDRWTPLHYAASNGKLDAARQLVQLNCKLNSKNVFRWTPLRYAHINNHESVAVFLRSLGRRF